MFKQILVPTDGSAPATNALHAAAELAARLKDVRVTLLTVIHLTDASLMDLDEELVAIRNKRIRREAENVVGIGARFLAERNIEFDTVVLEGDPVSAVIADQVKKDGHDCIVMGSRGLGLEKDNLSYIGSVTEHVIRRVDVPVIVIPVHEV